jgi:hypothetical protein
MIHGIGAKKCAEYGDDLIAEISNFAATTARSAVK